MKSHRRTQSLIAPDDSKLSDLEFMPFDIRMNIAKHLSLRDNMATGLTSKTNYGFFKSPEFWRSLAIRDFGYFADAKITEIKYRQLHLEPALLIAKTQVFISCRAQLFPYDIGYENELLFPDITRYHQQDYISDEENLSSLLRLRLHSQFIESANTLTQSKTSSVQNERRVTSLYDIYNNIILANTPEAHQQLSDTLELMPRHEANELQIDLNSKTGMIMVMLSQLAKCGANHALHKLLTQLPPAIKAKFIECCGANLCRDAITFGRLEMVIMLIEHGVNVNAEAKISDFYDGTELQFLPTAIKSAITYTSLIKTELIKHNPTADAKTFLHDCLNVHGSIIRTLMINANIDKPRRVICFENGRSSIFETPYTSIRSHAKDLMRFVNQPRRLTAHEQTMLGDIIEPVIHSKSLDAVNDPGLTDEDDRLPVSPLKKCRI